MRFSLMRSLLIHPCGGSIITVRSTTTSAQYVASRSRDPVFEKLMDKYKNLLKVIAIQDLILANPTADPPSVSIEFLSRLSQKLHLNRGAASFLRKLTDVAMEISRQEALAINATLSLVVDCLARLLSMSISKSIPLRVVFKVWRELGLPDDFEDSVISKNPHIFRLSDGHEPNTHILEFVQEEDKSLSFEAAVEQWRVVECYMEDCSIDRTEIQFSFKHSYPPGMRLSKNFKAKVKEWQMLPYVGPYEDMVSKKKNKSGVMGIEKRAVAVAHEFLSLTVEKMVEVEKISHFRKWFGIDLNIRDLFLDHPGMFYMSTKGKRHTVFLREAYERRRLIDPNPVYEARRKLLDLVLLGRHAALSEFRDTNPKMSEEE